VADLKIFILRHPPLSLSALYLLFRLVNLTLLPVFIDESTYIDWGWRTTHISGLFFFPLAFYKMPLIMWFFGFAQYLVSNPLIAGRLVGILTGWLALSGLYKLTRTVFNLHTAVIACLLYIFVPIFVFFDRQALMESALSAAGLWSCYFLYRLVERPKILWSSFLGLSLGLGCLTKANGLIFVPPAFLIIFYSAWKDKPHRFKLLTHTIITFSVLLLIMSPILFQSLFWQTIHNVSDFTLTLKELLGFPFLIWSKNLLVHIEIGFWYLTPLLFLTVFLGWKKIPIVTAWSIITLVLTTFLVRNGSPRYLVPYLPPLLIFSANWLSKNIRLAPFFILPALSISCLLIINPPVYFILLSHLTKYSQSFEYFSGQNTGYQALATINYLQRNLPDRPIYVSVAANAGNPEQAVFNYMRRRPDTYIGYLDDKIFPNLTSISCFSSSVPVYFVARHNEQGDLYRFFSLVATVKNPYNNDYNNIYTLNSHCTGTTVSLDPLISYYHSVL
jgi:4-amino-4-deoxy-L-arabinose transferase-like glycosyltransferase